MGVSLKTEQRRSHSAVPSFRPWVRRAEGYRGTRHLKPCMEVAVNPRRPPSLPLICEVLPDHSSFSYLRETPMASAIHFKKPNRYENKKMEYWSNASTKELPILQHSITPILQKGWHL
jgi:hypothetical protein